MEQGISRVHPVIPIRQSHDDASQPGQWLLEGGDDGWEELAEAICSRLEDVIAGGVLEVISWCPDIEISVSTWCAEAGHELLEVVHEGASTRLRIRKGNGRHQRFPLESGEDR